jgi:hypothetical protein
MSSSYRILCLSHDPAIVIEGLEWSNCQDMEAAIARVGSDELEHHRGCDLVGGRYSAPLIEVYCPPARGPDTVYYEHALATGIHHPRHNDGRWIDVSWLRLLASVYIANSPPLVTQAAAKVDRCWSKPRVVRLRWELGIDGWTT